MIEKITDAPMPSDTRYWLQELTTKLDEVIDELNELQSADGWLNQWGRDLDKRVQRLEKPRESAKKEGTPDGWVKSTKTYTFTEKTVRDEAVEAYKKRLVEKLDTTTYFSIDEHWSSVISKAIQLVEETE